MAQELENNSTIHPDEVQEALTRIFNSKYFSNASKKRKFLRLICDFYLNGRASELNEYLIGCEVFERKPGYNPATDPIVRVGAHNIREKLELYYQHEGARDEIRLDIPIGSYEPIFVRTHNVSPVDNTSQNSLEPESEPNLESKLTIDSNSPSLPNPTDDYWHRILKRRDLIFVGVTVISLISALILIVNNLTLRRQILETASISEINKYGQVWEPFLNSESPTLLVLSNPVVYRLLNAGDPETVAKKSVGLTSEQTALLAQTPRDSFAVRNSLASPRLVLSIDTYTGIGEAIGVQRITDLLRTANKIVVLKRSRTVSAEDLKNQNVVLFGSIWANEWSGKLSMPEDFVVTNQATIENHHPFPGEEKIYRSRFDQQTDRLLEDYAVITVKPNISEGKVIMVLAGLRSAGTEAAAEYITNKSHLNELNHLLEQKIPTSKIPRYYQVLLKVGVEDGIPTTISLVAIHELAANK